MACGCESLGLTFLSMPVSTCARAPEYMLYPTNAQFLGSQKLFTATRHQEVSGTAPDLGSALKRP